MTQRPPQGAVTTVVVAGVKNFLTFLTFEVVMSTDSDFFLKKTITRQIKPLACEKFIITATKPKFDKDGTPIMKQINSKSGKPLFDMNGDPIMTQVMVAINLCRENKESEQTPWTLENLLLDHNLNKIKSLNVRDYAIYITPQEQGTDKIHILVDDTSDAIFEIFGKPNNFLQTSPKSQQAIYTVPYTHQRDLYNEVFKYMNIKYGDPNLSGLRHPFRLAGFSNRKQKYMDNDGKFPFVKTISTCKEMSPQLIDFIEKCACGDFPIIDEVKRLKDKYKAVDQYDEDGDDTPASVSKTPIPAPAPAPRPGGSGIAA